MPEFQQYVCGFLFSERRNLVVLIKKEKPEWQKGMWNGVGGKIEPGEMEDEAMSREFLEEAGVLTSPSNWTEIIQIRSDTWQVTFFYLISNILFSAHTMETEKIMFHNPNSLPENVIPNLRWLIPLALDDDIGKPLGMRGISLTDAPLGGKIV